MARTAIVEDCDSNLGPKTGYYNGGASWFSLVLRENALTMPQSRPRPLPNTSVTNHHSQVIQIISVTDSVFI